MKKEEAFINYTSECLKACVNNIANIAGGTEIKQSFREMFLPDTTEKDQKAAAEIIEKLKLAFTNEGGDNS